MNPSELEVHKLQSDVDVLKNAIGSACLGLLLSQNIHDAHEEGLELARVLGAEAEAAFKAAITDPDGDGYGRFRRAIGLPEVAGGE